MKLTDDPDRLLLRALKFHVDILETKKLSYMVRLTYKFGHVTRLFHGLKGKGIFIVIINAYFIIVK